MEANYFQINTKGLTKLLILIACLKHPNFNSNI